MVDGESWIIISRMSIKEEDRKIINRLVDDDYSNSRRRNPFITWPFHMVYSLNGLKFWQSFLNYSTRLLSYPFMAMNA